VAVDLVTRITGCGGDSGPRPFTFAALIVLRDGLMAEESVFYDTAGFFRQLGATTG
jgi:hypothetical protein